MTLKSSVKKNESITYCSLYIDGVETKFNQAIRNDDEDALFSKENNSYLMENLPLLIALGRPIGNVRNEPICDQTLAQAHRYVLYNCDAIARFIK